MTERDELLAYALQEGFASEDEVMELWEDPDFFPDGFNEVDDGEPGFFDNVTEFLGAASFAVINFSKRKGAKMLAEVLFGLEGAVAVEVYQRTLEWLGGR